MALSLSEFHLDPSPVPLPLPGSWPEKEPLSPMGAGLVNLGNTCFLNAVLQCFTHTVPFVQSLRSCFHAAPCPRENGGFCVLCTLKEHIELSLASSGRIISPTKLVENLNHLSSSFRRYEQEDAHEFLQCLLDSLHRCCLSSKSQDQPSSSQDDSFVKQIFGGRLRSRVRCCNCGYCSDTFESLIDLSLDIRDVDTLSTALESFTQVEKIEDAEMKFTCESCREKVSVEKQLMLEQVPSVATFHLKRFKSYDSYIEKIDTFVGYPLELDLQPFLSSSDSNNEVLKYELYAVVVHLGFSPDSGHYISFIRSSPDTWHRLDDSKVMRVGEATVLSQEAYILFYIRKGSPWFSSLMETQRSCPELSSASTSPKSVLDDTDIVCASFADRVGDPESPVRDAKDDTDSKSVPFTDTERGHNSPVREANDEAENMEFRPLTPTRPSSPEITFELPSEIKYQIPRQHLKDQRDWKKPARDAFEDGREKAAVSNLLSRMPSSRRSSLMACIASRGCQSEGSLNGKKRKRIIGLDTPRSDGEAPPSAFSPRSLSPRSLNRCFAGTDSPLLTQLGLH